MVGSAVNLANVMQQLADQLDTITGLRVHAHPPDKITPPAAVVDYPDTYTYDETYARGMDHMEVNVVLLVAKTPARNARAALAKFCDGSGVASVKAVLEAGTYTAMHTVRVTKAVFDIVGFAGVEYLAATFTIDVTGQGA